MGWWRSSVPDANFDPLPLPPLDRVDKFLGISDLAERPTLKSSFYWGCAKILKIKEKAPEGWLRGFFYLCLKNSRLSIGNVQAIFPLLSMTYVG